MKGTVTEINPNNNFQQRSDILDDSSWKIALCSPEYEFFRDAMSGKPAGATYLIQKQLAEGLRARGHDLTFMAQYSLGLNVCTKDAKKPEIAKMTWSDLSLFKFTSRLVWRLQQLLHIPYLNVFSNYRLYDASLNCLPGHDLVYERNGLFRTGIAMACKRLKIPYILFVEADEILEHDFLDKPMKGILRWRAKQMFRYNLHSADYITCVSKSLKSHLVNSWDVSPDKIAVFPNKVDVQWFRPDSVMRSDFRETLDVKDHPVVIFVGNFYEWHDTVTLLEAFSKVLAVHPDARLVMVGDGDRRSAMVQYAAELDIEHAVQFTGLVAHSDVPGLLNAADLAVAPVPPKIRDSWLSPLKVYEYMASGTAVIASANGQLMDVIQDGFNGCLVPPGDVTAMTSALKRLIEDEELRTRLGKQARQDAIKNHSWNQYINRLEQLFATVIQR